jgi:ABC-type transport system involved in multi-copper enzyme maturation permease subunit
MVPLLVLFVPSLVIAGLLGFGIPPSSPGYGIFLALVFVFFLLYTVGLSALGGLGGTWARANTDWNLDPVRWL